MSTFSEDQLECSFDLHLWGNRFCDLFLHFIQLTAYLVRGHFNDCAESALRTKTTSVKIRSSSWASLESVTPQFATGSLFDVACCTTCALFAVRAQIDCKLIIELSLLEVPADSGPLCVRESRKSHRGLVCSSRRDKSNLIQAENSNGVAVVQLDRAIAIAFNWRTVPLRAMRLPAV